MCTSLRTISTLAFKRTASPHILRSGPARRSSRSQPTTVFLRYRGETECMLDSDVVILAGADSTLGSKSFLDKVQIVLPPDPTRSNCQALHVTLRVPYFRECMMSIYFQPAPRKYWLSSSFRPASTNPFNSPTQPTETHIRHSQLWAPN